MSFWPDHHLCWVYGAQSPWNLEFKTTLVSSDCWMFSCLMMVIVLLRRLNTICSCCVSVFALAQFAARIPDLSNSDCWGSLFSLTQITHTKLLSLSPTCLHKTHTSGTDWLSFSVHVCLWKQPNQTLRKMCVCVCVTHWLVFRLIELTTQNIQNNSQGVGLTGLSSDVIGVSDVS